MKTYYTEIAFKATKKAPADLLEKNINYIMKRKPSDCRQEYGNNEYTLMYDFRQYPALRKAIGRLLESGVKTLLVSTNVKTSKGTERIKELSVRSRSLFCV